MMKTGEVCLETNDVIRMAEFYKWLLNINDNQTDEVIHQRLQARPAERGFTTEEAIRPHIEYNQWFRKNRGKFPLFIDNSTMTEEETADKVAAFVAKWSLGESNS